MTRPPSHVPGPGSLIAGRYRLATKLGGGGMGAVWLARDQRLDRDVAVKQVVSTDGLTAASADDIRNRALREGRIAARLHHRNAIAMHDVALESGQPWLVMEYIPSRTMAQILHTTATVAPLVAAQIGAQVAAAMVAAHADGIIHRDIKPGNILVATTGPNAGTIRISDFGISRTVDDVDTGDDTVITGTPAYFAPEIARGGQPSEASDVYSLGATIYTLVEGVPPFGIDEDSVALLHTVARGQINPPIRAGILRSAVLEMLQPSPSRRPTMAQARDMLASAAAQGASVQSVLTAPLPTTPGGLPIWGSSPRSTVGRRDLSPPTESGLPAVRAAVNQPSVRNSRLKRFWKRFS